MAVSLHHLLPAAKTLKPTPAPSPFNTTFAGFFPGTTAEGFGASDAFTALAESVLLRFGGVHFLYTIVDSGSGRELQNKSVHNIAGLGTADGDRPFRPFARPVPFVPRSTIRIEIEEMSAGPFFKDGTRFIVLHATRGGRMIAHSSSRRVKSEHSADAAISTLEHRERSNSNSREVVWRSTNCTRTTAGAAVLRAFTAVCEKAASVERGSRVAIRSDGQPLAPWLAFGGLSSWGLWVSDSPAPEGRLVTELVVRSSPRCVPAVGCVQVQQSAAPARTLWYTELRRREIGRRNVPAAE